MIVRSLFCALALSLCCAGAVFAAADATYTGPESAAERTFVARIQADLMKRFPRAGDAVASGYVRYTDVDDTGAISYANCGWSSVDGEHPSQLWYDRKGALLGADFSVLRVRPGESAPHVWGIDPGRWAQLDGHVHWVTKDRATGVASFEHYMPDAKFSAAGGNPRHPSARTLLAAHRVGSAADVVAIFHFPALWDLPVWVKPNANGAFAEKNPAVSP